LFHLPPTGLHTGQTPRKKLCGFLDAHWHSNIIQDLS